jgi:hypothetical protein
MVDMDWRWSDRIAMHVEGADRLSRVMFSPRVEGEIVFDWQNLASLSFGRLPPGGGGMWDFWPASSMVRFASYFGYSNENLATGVSRALVLSEVAALSGREGCPIVPV